MQKQLFKNSSKNWTQAVLNLQKEIKYLKATIYKKDTVIYRKDCEIASLKRELECERNLTFRERIFWKKKKKKSESRQGYTQALRGMEDQVVAMLKSWYSDQEIAQSFWASLKNIRRFIKYHCLR